MAYKPTGYPTGRPRKGEIRPETKQGKACREWRERNREKNLEMQRMYNQKFREEQPERWAEIQRGVRLRKKGWDGTKLSVGMLKVNIELGRNKDQVILAQVDS